MTFPVLFDACVLLPYQLCDLLLRLAEKEMYRPLWSEQILQEVERNLIKSFGTTEQQAHRRVDQMRAAFPLASVANYENLVPAMTNHPKDRHVLAAAVKGGAALIVTANLKDFPAEALSPYGIEAVHPDEFLQDQLDLDSECTKECIAEQRAAYKKPKLTAAEFYESLRVTVPGFADQAKALEGAGQDAIRHPLPPDVPLPLEIVSDEDAHDAFFPNGEGPDPTTPLGAAVLWWRALMDLDQYRTAIENLSYNPGDWGDYRQAAAELDDWALMQNIVPCEGDPDTIAYARFMNGAKQSMRAFAEAPLWDVQVLTLVRCPDGWWRIWGLSRNYFPSAARVTHGTED
jgi:predicted nucleic acid-binding protein